MPHHPAPHLPAVRLPALLRPVRSLPALLLVASSAALAADTGTAAPPTQRATQFELRATSERLDAPQANWRATELDLQHRFAPRLVAYGTAADTERFGLQDQHFLAGLYAPLGTQWTLNTEFTASPTHRAREIGSSQASLQYSLGGGWDLVAGLKRTDYDLGHLQGTQLRADYYFGSQLLSVGWSRASIGDANATAQSLQLSHFYGEGSSVTARYGWGDEIDLIAAGTNRLGTRSWGVNGLHWVDPNWALTWMASQTVQDGATTRTGLSLGIRRAF